MYVYVADVLQVSEVWWGYINTSFFIGLLIAGVLYSKWSSIILQSVRKLLIITSFGVAAVTLLFGFNNFALAALLLSFLSGLLEQLKGITLNLYLQKTSSAELLPKLYSVQNVVVSLGFGLSTLLFGWIAEMVHVQAAFCTAGGILIIAAAYLYVNRKEFIPLRQI